MGSEARAGAAGQVVAVAGALVFGVSLAGFAIRYAGAFGTPAGAWTLAAWRPVVVDLSLFTAFALHHSALARMGVRRAVARVVSPALERSVYVWVASLLFLAVCGWWQPVPGVAWRAAGATRVALLAVQVLGLAVTAEAARHLDVFDLAGVRQARGGGRRPAVLVERGGYARVRHPIYLGWVLIVWATPVLTGTRLVFAAVSTAYLVAAIPWEERDLVGQLGAAYTGYAARVRWRLVPWLY